MVCQGFVEICEDLQSSFQTEADASFSLFLTGLSFQLMKADTGQKRLKCSILSERPKW